MKLALPTSVPQPRQAALAQKVIDLTRDLDADGRAEAYRVAGWLMLTYEHPDAGDVLTGFRPDDERPLYVQLYDAAKQAEAAGLLTRAPQKDTDAPKEETPRPKRKRRTRRAKPTPPADQTPEPEPQQQPELLGVPMFLYLPPAHVEHIEALRRAFAQLTGQDIKHSHVVAMIVEAVLAQLGAERTRLGRPLEASEIATLLSKWADASATMNHDRR